MNKVPLWLTVPQAVVLEAARNIDLALGLTDDDPNLLVIKANHLLAPRTVIPLEADADQDQRVDAFKKFQEAKTALQVDSRYLQAQRRVEERLVAGVTAKASRTPGGPCEDVDPVEFTRVKLSGVDAVDKKTQTVSLYDLRINGFEYIESVTGEPTGLASASSSGKPLEIHEHPSQVVEKWDCTGDPLPKLIDWVRSRWGDDPQKLPSRLELLRIFRGQFGHVLGINEKTMREVRRQLAPREARLGGAPMHRRQPGK